MNTNILQTLVTAMQRRLAALPQRSRPFIAEFDELPKNLMLTGARERGKSTFLLHHSQDRRLLYFSADNPKIVDEPLYNLVSSAFMLGHGSVTVDEIHYTSSWGIHLKTLYDDYPGKIIWISDSPSLVLRGDKADLSRRYVAIQMSLMSFREFLYLETGQIYPKCELGDTILPIQSDTELLGHFLDYRSYDTRPFYQEKDFEIRYVAIIDRILNNNIPFFLPSISENSLRMMRAIIGTLAGSSISHVQVISLCSDWGIGAEKPYQLLFVMESVDLLKIVRYPSDTKARNTGTKMLLTDPCAYKVLNAGQGTKREAYVVHCSSRAGYEINAIKNEKRDDYVITRDHVSQILEAGKKNKNPKEANYILGDNIDYPIDSTIPFWLMDVTQQSFVMQRW